MEKVSYDEYSIASESPNAWMEGTYFELLPRDVTQNLLGEILSQDPVIFSCRMQETPITLEGHNKKLSSAQFNEKADKIVTTALWDDTAKIWKVSDGSLIVTLVGHTGMICSAQFNEQGDKVVTGAHDDTAKIWSVEGGSLLTTLTGHKSYVKSAQFNKQGDKVVTVSGDGSTRIWRVENGTLLFTFNEYTGSDAKVAFDASAQFNEQGDKVVTTSHECHSGTISPAKIWSVENGALLVTLRGHREVTSAQFNKQGDKVVTTFPVAPMRVWHAENGSLLYTLNTHDDSASFNNKGDKIVTYNRHASVWQAENGSLLFDFFNPPSWFGAWPHVAVSAQFNEQGDKIVTAADDGTAKIWYVEDGLLLATLAGHTGHVNSARFNKQGDKIVTASDDGTAKIWQQKALSFKQLVILHGAVNFLMNSSAGLVNRKEEIFRAAEKLALQKNMAFTDALIEMLHSYQKTYSKANDESSKTYCCLS